MVTITLQYQGFESAQGLTGRRPEFAPVAKCCSIQTYKSLVFELHEVPKSKVQELSLWTTAPLSTRLQW
jgi:hypothetical protein